MWGKNVKILKLILNIFCPITGPAPHFEKHAYPKSICYTKNTNLTYVCQMSPWGRCPYNNSRFTKKVSQQIQLYQDVNTHTHILCSVLTLGQSHRHPCRTGEWRVFCSWTQLLHQWTTSPQLSHTLRLSIPFSLEFFLQALFFTPPHLQTYLLSSIFLLHNLGLNSVALARCPLSNPWPLDPSVPVFVTHLYLVSEGMLE